MLLLFLTTSQLYQMYMIKKQQIGLPLYMIYGRILQLVMMMTGLSACTIVQMKEL